MVELSRYRCFLLGLPEELLPTTAEGIIQVFHARAALLRDDFDDAVERSWSRAAFLGVFAAGRRPVSGRWADAYALRVLNRRLVTYGSPDHATGLQASHS